MGNIRINKYGRIDHAGKVYGRLTVISYSHTSGKRAFWHCECSCGKKCIIRAKELSNENIKSCGCLRSETKGLTAKTHGEAVGKKTKEYNTWRHLRNRCNNKNNHKYPIYGGRGIKVCDRWVDSYENFLEDMGRAPSKSHSIDRINVNGNYEPSNCKWSNPTEQMNNRQNSVYATINGRTQTIIQWSRELGISQYVAYGRIKRGWSHENAILTPVRKIKRRTNASKSQSL